MKLYDNVKINVDMVPTLKLKVCKTKIDVLMDESVNSLMSANSFTRFDLAKSLLHGKIVTHSGQFHADEIMCVALILLIRDTLRFKETGGDMIHSDLYRWNYERIRDTVIRRPNGLDPNNNEDVELYLNAIVLDIENGHFDHHHKNIDEAPKIEKGDSEFDRVASIGALWQYLGHLFDIERDESVSKDIPNMNVYDRMWDNFFLPISLLDVYGPNKFSSPVSQLISNINGYTDYDFDFVIPESLNPDPDYMKFIEAVLFAYKILRGQLIKEQNFITSLYGMGSNPYIKMNAGDVPNVTIEPVPEGTKEPKVNIESLKYVLIDGADKPLVLINKNPSDRDGSYRMISVDSEYAHFDKTLLDKPAPGQMFLHPALFMITFDTINNLSDFLGQLTFDEESHTMYYNYSV